MAKDLYHDAVKTALIKEGWIIVEEGYQLQPDEKLNFFIDILAEKYVIAKKEKQWIIVEVKTFGQKSVTYQFHAAIGQYITYHTALEYLKIDRILYLAIPDMVYNELFQYPFVKYLIEKYQIQLLPFDPEEKILIR